jgi:hypothetical protein
MSRIVGLNGSILGRHHSSGGQSQRREGDGKHFELGAHRCGQLFQRKLQQGFLKTNGEPCIHHHKIYFSEAIQCLFDNPLGSSARRNVLGKEFGFPACAALQFQGSFRGKFVHGKDRHIHALADQSANDGVPEPACSPRQYAGLPRQRRLKAAHSPVMASRKALLQLLCNHTKSSGQQVHAFSDQSK